MNQRPLSTADSGFHARSASAWLQREPPLHLLEHSEAAPEAELLLEPCQLPWRLLPAVAQAAAAQPTASKSSFSRDWNVCPCLHIIICSPQVLHMSEAPSAPDQRYDWEQDIQGNGQQKDSCLTAWRSLTKPRKVHLGML